MCRHAGRQSNGCNVAAAPEAAAEEAPEPKVGKLRAGCPDAGANAGADAGAAWPREKAGALDAAG